MRTILDFIIGIVILGVLVLVCSFLCFLTIIKELIWDIIKFPKDKE